MRLRRARAVHREQCSNAPRPARLGGIGEIAVHRAVGIESPIVQYDGEIRVARQRRRLVDDDETFKTAPHQFGRAWKNAGPIAKESGIVQRAAIVEGRAGRDRSLSERDHPVHRVVAAHALPVQAHRQIGLVDETNGQRIALLVAQQRAIGRLNGAGRAVVEAENVRGRRGLRQESRFAGPRLQNARRGLSPGLEAERQGR